MFTLVKCYKGAEGNKLRGYLRFWGVEPKAGVLPPKLNDIALKSYYTFTTVIFNTIFECAVININY